MVQWDNLKGVSPKNRQRYIRYVKKKTDDLLRGKTTRYTAFADIQRFRNRIEPKRKGLLR
jgi:hypothetical protein